MAATLKMIAERAGLSQSTVSQILNRRSNDFSSEKTRELVFQLAHELGYKQKFGHKLLRGDKTRTVALLIDMEQLILEEHIQALIIRLLARLEQSGYSSYFAFLGGDETKNLASVRDLTARGVEGFIVIGAPTGEEMIEKEFIRQGKNYVGTGTRFARDVTVSALHSVRKILEFFLSHGRENFKLLLANEFESTSRFAALRELFPRLSAEELAARYCVRLQSGGGTVPALTPSPDEQGRIGYEATEALFSEDPTVSAIFYLSDYYVAGGLAFLVKSGRTPGREVLVAGYDNIHAVRTCLFPVSSAEHPTDEHAEALIEGLKQDGPFSRTLYSREIIRERVQFPFMQ